jgi:type III secretion system FlhB-like substrate exporter
MPRGKKELAEQIIPKLREVEVEVGRGKTVLEAVKKIGVTEQTYSDGRRSSEDCGSTRRSG